jgi:WhiB family transcriptional regulator, redox-sensing transcriptional regulator
MAGAMRNDRGFPKRLRLVITADSDAWQDRAACRGTDPDLFFPVGLGGVAVEAVEQAKRICATCPVLVPCGVYGTLYSPDYGVWGGMSSDERKARRARARRDRLAQENPT